MKKSYSFVKTKNITLKVLLCLFLANCSAHLVEDRTSNVNDPFESYNRKVHSLNKTLDKIELNVDHRSAATVVLVSGGYPSNYNKGIKITGIDHVVDSTVYHAGAIQKEGGVYTNGGRVLAITSFGNNFQEALDISYKSASKINFDRMYYRKDLGFDL